MWWYWYTSGLIPKDTLRRRTRFISFTRYHKVYDKSSKATAQAESTGKGTSKSTTRHTVKHTIVDWRFASKRTNILALKEMLHESFTNVRIGKDASQICDFLIKSVIS